MKTIYVLYKDNKLLMTHGRLDRALEWREATSNSILYEAKLTKIMTIKETFLSGEIPFWGFVR